MYNSQPSVLDPLFPGMSLSAPRCNTIVNVKYFGDDMTNDKLMEMFAKYGTVKSCKIMNEDCDESLRFAYVAFEDPDNAQDAVIELNGQRISDEPDSQRLNVRRTHQYATQAKPKTKRYIETKKESETKKPNDDLCIFVKNLDDTIDTEALRRVFRCFGTIVSAKIIMENGRSKGYGFVTFSTAEAAAHAVRDKNGRFLGREILYVCLARGTEWSSHRLAFRYGQLRPTPRQYTNTLHERGTPLIRDIGFTGIARSGSQSHKTGKSISQAA